MSDNKEFKDWIWTDELVAEYSLASQEKTLWDFKRSKQQPKEDYTITAFRSTLHSGNNIILTRNKDNTFHSSYAQGFDLLNSSIHEIYSVQRHSDNEVFSIGDEFLGDNERLTIESFKVHNNTIRLWAKEEGGYFVLSEIQKVKQRVPLFKDELGNDVFDFDIVSQVSLVNNYAIHSTIARIEICPPPSYFKYFLKPEDAIEYAVMNKTSLSLNDLLSVWDLGDMKFLPTDYYKNAHLFKNFKELAKSKINNQ